MATIEDRLDDLHKSITLMEKDLGRVQKVLIDLQNQLIQAREDRVDMEKKVNAHDTFIQANGVKEIACLVQQMNTTVTLLNRLVQGDSAIGYKGIDTRMRESEKRLDDLFALKSKTVWILIGIGLGNVVQLGYIISLAQKLATLLGTH